MFYIVFFIQMMHDDSYSSIMFCFRFAINWDNPSADAGTTITYSEGGDKMEHDIQHQDEGDVSMFETE